MRIDSRTVGRKFDQVDFKLLVLSCLSTFFEYLLNTFVESTYQQLD